MFDSRLLPAPIAIVGVGNMGLALALRLLERGHAVRVHDRLPERMALAAAAGAVSTPSAAQAAAGCELVIAVYNQRATGTKLLVNPSLGLTA